MAVLRLLRSWLGSPCAPSRSLYRPARRTGIRPHIEALEDRMLLTAGMLDPTFGLGGRAFADFNLNYPTGFSAASVAVQTDGKVVVAGGISGSFDGAFALVRFNADGSLDG